MILPAPNEDIFTTQAHPSQSTLVHIQMLHDYLNAYPNTKIRYKASDVKLQLDIFSYLDANTANSRISGYFYCNNVSSKSPPNHSSKPPFL